MIHAQLQASKPNYSYPGWRVCIYKNLWNNEYWHQIIPISQQCPQLTDNQLVYQFCFPFPC
ncbi:hypothetical protein ACX16A_27060 [Bacillus cereus]